MTGEDLLQLAGNLAANRALGNDEARFRSAVSRAYYGTFHIALELLAQFDVQVPQNAEAHALTQRYLLGTGNPDAQAASRLLNDLRGDRNEADYRLDKKRFAAFQNARLCVESAEDARRHLSNCLQEPARTQLAHHFAATSQ